MKVFGFGFLVKGERERDVREGGKETGSDEIWGFMCYYQRKVLGLQQKCPNHLFFFLNGCKKCPNHR